MIADWKITDCEIEKSLIDFENLNQRYVMVVVYYLYLSNLILFYKKSKGEIIESIVSSNFEQYAPMVVELSDMFSKLEIKCSELPTTLFNHWSILSKILECVPSSGK